MNDFNRGVIGGATDTDVGLKSFMLGTYRWMALAMAVTATVAFFFGQFLMANPQVAAIVYSPFVLLGFVFAIPVLFGTVGRKLPSMSLGGVVTFLFSFAAFMGVFMSAIALAYNPMIVAKIFFMTVAMFAALSMFGYSTQRDLGTFIKYAIAAFIGYVAINLLGAFFPALAPTGPLDTIINLVALGAIALITAWETQMLKRVYYGLAGANDGGEMMAKYSAFGAASLLLAFINMFQILLALFGRD
ncbi:MAG: Bax inhibitor-1/YccA family protein [Litorimonas sp.]